MNLKREELIEWCWENLQFDNDPETWEDTYIIDILENYQGTARKADGKLLSYSDIRVMFQEDDDEEEDDF